MEKIWMKRLLYILLAILGIRLAMRYLLPIAVPFLLGTLLALAAEPLVHFASQRWKIPRSWASGAGIGLTLVLLLTLAGILGAVAVKELGAAASRLPDMADTAAHTLGRMRGVLVETAQKAPESIRPLVTQTVENAFPDNGELVQTVTDRVPGVMADLIAWLPRGALGIFTGILSAFMISARLPKLKAAVANRLPESLREKYLPMLRQIRKGLWGWLKAQLKLMVITWVILGVGLSLLGVELGIAWAGVIALVDAVPVLGTGTVLIPWALVCFLQGRLTRAAGLLMTYAVALTVRTALEPRLVGKQLGLDPLVTLAAFYAGFVLWGFWGMLLSPVLASAIGTAFRQKNA